MNQELLISPQELQKYAAILYLPVLPKPDWYSKNIAGVPFLLRNILVLQKYGVDKLVIWADEKMDDALGVVLELIKADPRLQLNWHYERSLSSFPNKSCIIVFNGSTAIDECGGKANIVKENFNGLTFLPESLKQFSQEKEIFILQPNTLEPAYKLQNEKDFQEMENRLLKSGGLNNDSFLDRLVTRFISRRLTGIFLKTSLTPNQITFLSLIVGLVAALCFFKGNYEMGIVGSVLLLISAWIDCTDGEVARLKFMVSEWGSKLDIIADNIVHCFVFFSIGMGLFYSTGDPVFKFLGLLAVSGSLVSFLLLGESILGKKAEATKNPLLKVDKKNISDHLANRDFTYFLFVLALFGRLDVFIFLTAIGSNIFAAYLGWQKFKVRSG